MASDLNMLAYTGIYVKVGFKCNTHLLLISFTYSQTGNKNLDVSYIPYKVVIS